MSNLAELIEQYLRGILTQKKTVELQRRELAKIFRCAPSQINYVLETRFTFERGFIVESKRGGGGFIRITQVVWNTSENLPQFIQSVIPDSLTVAEVEDLLARLVEQNMLSGEMAQISFHLMLRDFSELPAEYAENMRAKFLKALLLVLGSKINE